MSMGNQEDGRPDTPKLDGRVGSSGQIIGDDGQLDHGAPCPLSVGPTGSMADSFKELILETKTSEKQILAILT
jgi:hypothetical protein